MNQSTLDHSKAGNVRFSDPNCICVRLYLLIKLSLLLGQGLLCLCQGLLVFPGLGVKVILVELKLDE